MAGNLRRDFIDGTSSNRMLARIDVRRKRRAVGTQEPERLLAVGNNAKLARVMTDVMAFAQQDKIVQIRSAAVDPVLDVMRVQSIG